MQPWQVDAAASNDLAIHKQQMGYNRGGRRMRYKSTRRRGKTNRRRGKTNRRRVKTHRRRHRKH